jgi:DNA-binding CsgD family transcriptional regulator
MSAAVTARQLEILRLVARGMTSKEIARHEGISLHTVNTHVRRARRALGVGTRAAAVARIARRRVGYAGTPANPRRSPA